MRMMTVRRVPAPWGGRQVQLEFRPPFDLWVAIPEEMWDRMDTRYRTRHVASILAEAMVKDLREEEDD